MHGMKEDFDSLVAKTPLSDGVDRRRFLKTALGTGFAAAVLPVTAQSMIIPLESVEKMKGELAKGGSKSEFVVYPNAGHAFHADYRPSYVEADARDGWQRCLAWFKSHGVA